MKKIIFILFMAALVGLAIYFISGTESDQQVSINPPLVPPASSPSDSITECLTEEEAERGLYGINSSGTYIGTLVYREGIVLVAVKDKSCEILFTANREGTEFRDVGWEG
jgi:hypothetical protein